MTRTNSWLALSVTAVAVALFACRRGTPESVCQHMIDLAQKDGKYEDADEAKKRYEDCLGDVGDIKKELGDDRFEKFTKCVLDQDDFDDARKNCDPDDFK